MTPEERRNVLVANAHLLQESARRCGEASEVVFFAANVSEEPRSSAPTNKWHR